MNATNLNLLTAGLRQMSRQEYFVYVGMTYAMSFYPKFTTRELMSPSATIRRSSFIAVPDLSQYMTCKRYVDITNHMSFITPEQHRISGNTNAFWEVDPLVNAYNHCRRENYRPGIKLVVDESMFEWLGKDHRYGKDG